MKYCKDCKYHVAMKKLFGRTKSYCNHIESAQWSDNFRVTGNVNDRRLLECDSMRRNYNCGTDAKLFEPLIEDECEDADDQE